MGKTREEHELAITALVEQTPEIYEIVHIFDYYADLRKSQFYNLGLDESESIKKALSANLIEKKAKVRRRWLDSDNPTLSIAGYKLLAAPDELEKLTSSKVEAKVDAQASFKSVDDWKEYIKGLNE